MRKALVLLTFVVAILFSADAQLKNQTPSMLSVNPERDIICYGKHEDQHTIINPPMAYLQWKQNKNLKTNASQFEVTYIGFPDDGVAQTAFQKALDIWSTLIESEVPIRVLASWQTIQDENGSSSNVLGSANPGTYFRDFEGAQRSFTWYPIALAEKMARKELNTATTPDILARFNSAYPSWYFGVDGIPQTGKTDFVTVVLHEIGHGLGITKSYDVVEPNGVVSGLFSPLHIIYDHFIENSSEKNLLQNFPPPSTSLKAELTSGELYFRTTQLDKPAGGADSRAILYAPDSFEGGSSIAHLDELAYNNTDNTLMTPQIGTAEVAHDPGPVIMKMLADMGWINTQIQHTALTDTENVVGPYQVKVILTPDKANGYNYNPDEVKLHHTTDGITFTAVPMLTTANVNEFSANIPSTGGTTSYGYYISVKDNLARSIYKPGISAEDGESPVNLFLEFKAGPDTQAPFINHTARPFILASEGELSIEAIISDNIGVLSAALEYKINEVDQTPVSLSLKAGTDSTYAVTVPVPGLQNGDKIKYRIRARDISVAQNEIVNPTSEFYELNVVTLAPTQEFYSNDFNSITDDFTGDKIFSITTPPGFSNGAIHTSHPYPNGTGTGFISNSIYQLKIPVRLKAVDATLQFDEIVLVEPGDVGSVFGGTDFFDYVIVEGSKDGGITWKPLVNGYDSRDDATWLAEFNSSNDSEDPPNSNAAGDPSLFKQRFINMTANGNFVADDEIVIRFRLFADQLVHGWGWAIDNLKIQIDQTPPVILHNHYDFFNLASPTLSITTKVSDNSGVSKLFVDYKIKNEPTVTEDLPISENTDLYTLNLNINGLATGDLVEYRIRCIDSNGNEAMLPAIGFFSAPVLNIEAPVTQYIADFNSANTDFTGNFFSVTQPSGFSNGAIHSTHPYPDGFGLTNSISDYIYILKKPIIINASNPYMIFDEIGIVEYNGNGVKDLMVVEGSKDNGVTWEPFLNPYSALANPNWKNAFDLEATISPALYRSRLINLTSSGKFADGDNVLIRFRLTADGTINGWGWSIDNLSIQGPVTGIEKNTEAIINMYPNPVMNGILVVELTGKKESLSAGIEIFNAQGQALITDQAEFSQDINRKVYSVGNWSQGLYILRVNLGNGTILTRKFIKSDR